MSEELSCLENEPSVSVSVGIGAWAGLVLVSLPLALAGLLSDSFESYGPAAVLYMLCTAYGGVVTGWLEARSRRSYTGLIVSSCAFAVAVLFTATIVLGMGWGSRLWPFTFALPLLLGPLVAPMVAARGAGKSPLLTLVFFGLAPGLGVIAASFISSDWSTDKAWQILIIVAHLQFGPWIRPLGKILVPLIPSLPGSPPSSLPGDWVDVPVALLVTAELIGLIIVFAWNRRLRPSVIIPYAALTTLWAALGMFQLIRWIHQGE